MNPDSRFCGRFPLERFPLASDPSLRAWDAADEYLAAWAAGEADERIGERCVDWCRPSEGRVLVLNDRFGALTVAALAAGAAVENYSDSWLSLEATRRQVASILPELEARVRLLPMSDLPSRETDGAVGQVFVRVPKSNAFLREQLSVLADRLAAGVPITGGEMTRNVHSSTVAAFEEVLGETRTTRAWRKSRLLLSSSPGFDGPSGQPPRGFESRTWEAHGITTKNHSVGFSSERLDRGTDLLIAALEAANKKGELKALRAIDLGCGNGILGAWALSRIEGCTALFRDQSFLSLASARGTVAQSILGGADRAVFEAGDALEGVASESADLILCNPPFHAQGAREGDTSRRMFSGSLRVLRSSGELWVVGNRHLGYHARLQRGFVAEVVASDSKFVVVRARKG